MSQTIAESQNNNSTRSLMDGPLWGICLGHTFTHWYSASFYILLPYITIELGLSVAQAGALVTVMFAAKTLIGMPIGAVTDMMRRKNLLLVVSLLLAAIPFIFMGFVNTYWLLMILVIVMGIGNEMWHPASFSILSTRFPAQKGTVFGLHGMAANLGDLLAPIVIGVLITSIAWREVVFYNVIPGVVASIMILVLLRNISVKAANASKGIEKITINDYLKSFKQVIQNKTVLLLSLASGFRAMAQSGLMTFLPLYLALEMELSPLWVGVYISILQGGGLLSAPIVGAVSDKYGARRVVNSGMILTSIMVITMTFIQVNWLLVGSIAIIGFFLYALRPVMHAWAMETTPNDMAGTTTSLVFTTQALMASIAPVIGGVLADKLGFTAAFYFIAAVILIGNFVIVIIPKSNHA